MKILKPFRIGKVLHILEKHSLLYKVNVIFTADHGMAAVTNVVNVSNYIDLSDPAIEQTGRVRTRFAD